MSELFERQNFFSTDHSGRAGRGGGPDSSPDLAHDVSIRHALNEKA